MQSKAIQKPSFDAWKYWTEVLIERLTSVVHIYNKPPYDDVYLLDADRQKKMAEIIDILRKMHGQMDDGPSIKKMTKAEIAAKDEEAISGLVALLQIMMPKLPVISCDMQYLLKSPWVENCTGKVAAELFCGAYGATEEGLGSGVPENGRLPAKLVELLAQEASGSGRPARHELQTKLQANRVDPLQRRRSTSLGSAGRVD